MRLVLAVWLSGLALGGGPVMAQETAKALAILPEAQLKRLRADPDRFAAGALQLVYGYGTAGAVTREAAEAAERIDLAERRARALAPFLQSDLDNDGAVSGAEVATRGAALAAGARARLLGDFGVADSDGDGSVAGPELRAMAEAAAVRQGGLQGVGYFAFDLDADGRLTVAEIEAVRAALAVKP